MARTVAAPVTTRMLAPELTEQDKLELLYRPVPQLVDDEYPPDPKRLWVTPQKASELVDKALKADTIRQRKIRISQTRRWRNLYLTQRFVNFLPNGPLVEDEDGILLNGMHRLSALASLREHDVQFGFWLFPKTPQWMFQFFDTGAVRNLKDVFHINSRSTGPQTPSAMRLAMRYEEFLAGVRSAMGWRHWGQVKDEHNDVDNFIARRGELQDWYSAAEKVNRSARLLVPSMLVFRFYQGLAWPDGADKLDEFCESLVTGEMLRAQSPALVLREWARDAYHNHDIIAAKREVHLTVLLRAFDQFARGTKVPRQVWAYGGPMTMPYHPAGPEHAIKVVRQALDELDQEAISK